MRVRWIGTYDPPNRLIRLIRCLWTHGTVGDGKGYSAKFTIGLRPRLFMWRRESDGWLLTLFGLRLHHKKAWGGIIC